MPAWRACAVLEVNDRRVSVWQSRRAPGLPLEDAPPGPIEALHGLLAWERQAIVELFDSWAEIDRSHRKLAHRGSRLGKVFVFDTKRNGAHLREMLVVSAPEGEELPEAHVVNRVWKTSRVFHHRIAGR